jgi:hypothetical protein
MGCMVVENVLKQAPILIQVVAGEAQSCLTSNGLRVL